jgi:hypothetical protein
MVPWRREFCRHGPPFWKGSLVVSDVRYFQEQAAHARKLAERATLPNVRARFLESAEVWTRLVERAERLEQKQTDFRGRSPRLI